MPQELLQTDQAIPYYRLIQSKGFTSQQSLTFSLEADKIIKQYAIVDWHTKPDIIRKMNFYISEYLIDVFHMPIEDAEKMAEDCTNVAKARHRL